MVSGLKGYGVHSMLYIFFACQLVSVPVLKEMNDNNKLKISSSKRLFVIADLTAQACFRHKIFSVVPTKLEARDLPFAGVAP